MKRAIHDLSHNRVMSGNLGYVIPISCYDVVPSDVIRQQTSMFLRSAPLAAPVMHNVDIDIDYYFCPDRIVYEDSEDFYTGGDDGLQNPTWPHIEVPQGGFAINSLADYLGLPTGADAEGQLVDARPFRVYGTTWNYYYRDSQLQSEVPVSLASGLDTTTSLNLLRPAWKRDYFTKARPAPQLGPEVVAPLSGDAPVQGIGFTGTTGSIGAAASVRQTELTSGMTNAVSGADTNTVNALRIQMNTNNTGTARPQIYAKLAEALGIPIREFREMNAVQRFLENNNLFGGRYAEQLRARFGMVPQDQRLQWPEFLGRGRAKIQFSEVLSTETDSAGQMKGHGISITGTNRFRYVVQEHGWILAVLVIRPKTMYMQGIHRMWSRKTRYDYLLPEFVHVGDQPIYNRELYAGASDPDGIFGWTPIYEDYRTVPSSAHGEMRDSLKYWHMARIFESEPALNSSFIQCNPTNRIYQATNAAQFYAVVRHSINARRPLPKAPGYRLM